MRSLLFGFLSGLICTLSHAQNTSYPKGYFGPPLEIPLVLAGNFAELRSGHFHAGLDIKTQGKEGLKVLASADGYVSRIKVSPFGYGKVIYVRHPNGYTTVYAHLQKFSAEIEAYIKEQQYAAKEFAIERFPAASRFTVKQGSVVGISGNSGGSVAPHLHFEIRETASEIPVNPLLFGFDIPDHVPPSMTTIKVHPMDELSHVNGKRNAVKYSLVKKADGSYRLASGQAIPVSGTIGISLEMIDRLDGAHNKCGIYDVKVAVDGRACFRQTMEKVGFHEKRFINAHVDYEEKVRTGRWFDRLHKLPNNRLSVYSEVDQSGLVTIQGNEIKKVRVDVSDVSGNASYLELELRGDPDRVLPDLAIKQPAKVFKCRQANSFERENIQLYLPANILYRDLDFQFKVDPPAKGALAPKYHIHNLYEPLHSHMAVSIKEDIDTRIRNRCLVVSYGKGGKIYPEGGYWKGDYLVVKTRSLGAYSIMADTIKPRITPINISPGANMSRKWSIMMKIEDNLSGITDYNGYIDGEWVLMDFDYKKKRLIHFFEEDLKPGEHEFKLIIKDKVGNIGQYETSFTR